MFRLKSNFKPTGDQPQAIEKLAGGILAGQEQQTLLGVTGSGKTFTMASVIERIGRPTLIISHNKTLAWQLYQEFKEFFPESAVEYFVSYYDYYQPEAYIPQSDTYIEKDARINKQIDQMRHKAVQSVLTRSDTIIVASVSCIYNLGSPQEYQQVSLHLTSGQTMTRRQLLHTLVHLGYTRNDIDPGAGNFYARGPRIEIYPPSGEGATSLILENDTIQKISTSAQAVLTSIRIFPAHFWVTPEKKLRIALVNIRQELQQHLALLRKQNRLVEAERLERRTNYDLELLEETGWCHSIENYSRHLEFRKAGSAPFTLLSYLAQSAPDFLTIIDESHMSLPQLHGMHNGDRARKTTLVEHGFRLPSAIDNRPLTYDEFDERVTQRIYASATPGIYELEESQTVAEQLLRPTALLDPQVEIRPTKNQMENAIGEIKKRIAKDQRILVITLTKRLAEDVTEYLAQEGIAVQYLHSEIHTLDRPQILNDLREGKYDVLVGINLLREGLDVPETSLVIIFDADKEGFLRNDTTLIQTMGRAARHKDGYVIMYADVTTGSMRRAIKETERRRNTQRIYNKKHGITPRSIKKKIYPLPAEFKRQVEKTSAVEELDSLSVKELERQMRKAAKNLDFERAAKLRDQIKKLTKADGLDASS